MVIFNMWFSVSLAKFEGVLGVSHKFSDNA